MKEHSNMNDVRTKIGEGGRVIIPVIFRQELHLKAGDDIILYFENNEIHITTPEQALMKLRAKVENYLNKTGESVSLVDELIAMRRAETAKDER
jgi:AbrB family looped-hinge helix DNA binding protein